MPTLTSAPARLAALVHVLAAVVAAAVAACGPTTVATPGPTVPAATVPGPESSSPGTPPASTGSPGEATELTYGLSVDLEPGRYTRAAFTPRITFEVGDGWRAVQAHEGFFDVQRDVGSPDVIAVQFARPEGFHGAGGELVMTTSAATAAATLQENPGLTVLGTSASRMSGLDGFVIEVENPPTASGPAQVLAVPPGPLSIDPGRRLWIALFDTPDGLVAILVGGSVEHWDEALLAAEPVLETVTIGQ